MSIEGRSHVSSQEWPAWPLAEKKKPAYNPEVSLEDGYDESREVHLGEPVSSSIKESEQVTQQEPSVLKTGAVVAVTLVGIAALAVSAVALAFLLQPAVLATPILGLSGGAKTIAMVSCIGVVYGGLNYIWLKVMWDPNKPEAKNSTPPMRAHVYCISGDPVSGKVHPSESILPF